MKHIPSHDTGFTTLHLENMASLAHIGITALERTIAQPVLWDVRVFMLLPPGKSSASPSASHVDYVALMEVVTEVTRCQHWVLIEDLVKNAAETITERFPLIVGGVVKLCKPYALKGVKPPVRVWIDYSFGVSCSNKGEENEN